jgi:hypothetical protein
MFDFYVLTDTLAQIVDVNDIGIAQDPIGLQSIFGCAVIVHDHEVRVDLMTFDLAVRIAAINPGTANSLVIRQIIADLEPATWPYGSVLITLWKNVGVETIRWPVGRIVDTTETTVTAEGFVNHPGQLRTEVVEKDEAREQ